MPRFEPLSEYRSTVESVPGGIEISTPARRNYFVAAFLACWLGGWFFGETSAISELLTPTTKTGGGTAFLFFWLCGWTIGGFFAAVMLLWTLAGRERVTVQNDAVSIRREAFGIGLGKHYELRSVKNLRAIETAGAIGGFATGARDPFGFSGGRMAFDYGAKTIHFGAAVDMAEARYLIAKIAGAKPTLSIA
jgi:hypothetical protein